MAYSLHRDTDLPERSPCSWRGLDAKSSYVVSGSKMCRVGDERAVQAARIGWSRSCSHRHLERECASSGRHGSVSSPIPCSRSHPSHSVLVRRGKTRLTAMYRFSRGLRCHRCCGPVPSPTSRCAASSSSRLRATQPDLPTAPPIESRATRTDLDRHERRPTSSRAA